MIQCSPCFNDYVALRENLDRSARARTAAVMAAVIVIATGSWPAVRSVRNREGEVAGLSFMQWLCLSLGQIDIECEDFLVTRISQDQGPIVISQAAPF